MALLIVINCTFTEIKNNIFFLKHESVYSVVCNFLGCYLAKSSFFFTEMPHFLIHKDIK